MVNIMKNNLMKKYPLKAFLYPTLSCNLNCKMCYSRGYNNSEETSCELSYEQYTSIIDKLISIGVSIFDISGGEPLLRNDILEICKYIKINSKSKIYFVSNGTLICKKFEVFRELLPYIDLLKISLDSPIPYKHNKIRGLNNAFQLTDSGIKMLIQEGFSNIGVNFVLMKSNYNDVINMLEYCLDLGIKSISLLQLLNVSPKGDLKEEVLSELSIIELVSQIERWIDEKEKSKLTNSFSIILVTHGALFPYIKVNNYKQKRISFFIEYDPLRGCSAYSNSIVISNKGDIFGCTAMLNNSDFYIGNIINMTVSQIQQNRTRFIEKINKREQLMKSKCNYCNSWNSCKGGCPCIPNSCINLFQG